MKDYLRELLAGAHLAANAINDHHQRRLGILSLLYGSAGPDVEDEDVDDSASNAYNNIIAVGVVVWMGFWSAVS